jgi:hypothetical protein
VCPRLRPLKKRRRRGHQVCAREPQPQGVRSQTAPINASRDGVADTFGTYNKPTSGGLARACALPSSDRPLQLSRPAALTALGARGLPPSPAAAKSRASPHRECCDAAGCQLVQRVEPGTDDAMAGIEIPAPQNPDAAHLRINSSEERKVPCRECKHRVR